MTQEFVTLPSNAVEHALAALIDKCIATYAIHGTSDYMIVDDGKARAELLDALHAALEQPQDEQEPVAILVGSGHLGGHFDWCTPGGPCLPPGTPFYTHPQPRQPLTDEEILRVKGQFNGTLDVQFDRFARAIEAAHNIK